MRNGRNVKVVLNTKSKYTIVYNVRHGLKEKKKKKRNSGSDKKMEKRRQ